MGVTTIGGADNPGVAAPEGTAVGAGVVVGSGILGEEGLAQAPRLKTIASLMQATRRAPDLILTRMS
ncbi:MAG TPA: hypothetical protein VI789_07070 [Dehalococcoidia bacterium]|nr:hypothetical protein [Dehalococcoidia bacterium]